MDPPLILGCCAILAITYILYIYQDRSFVEKHERLKLERLAKDAHIIDLQNRIEAEKIKQEIEREETKQLEIHEKEETERCRVENKTKVKQFEEKTETELKRLETTTEQVKAEYMKDVKKQEVQSQSDIVAKKEETLRLKDEASRDVDIAKQNLERSKAENEAKLLEFKIKQEQDTEKLKLTKQAETEQMQDKNSTKLEALGKFQSMHTDYLKARNRNVQLMADERRAILDQSNTTESGGWIKAKTVKYDIQTASLQQCQSAYENAIGKDPNMPAITF